VCDEGSLVGLCTQDYKSLCTVVMICTTLVNIQTHTHKDNILTSLYEQLSQLNKKVTSILHREMTRHLMLDAKQT